MVLSEIELDDRRAGKVEDLYSLLLMNARLAQNDEWTEAHIKQRAEMLARRVCAIWPGPEAAWKAQAGTSD
jgi:hypothetical protein